MLAALICLSSCASRPALQQVLAHTAHSVFAIADANGSRGSAFAVTPALLATNAHVLPDGELYVLLDGTRVRASVIASDEVHDLALLRTAITVQPLPLCAAPPALGMEVLALGNPFGMGIVATHGIIGGLPVTLGREVLQTDAAINAGNSGGPLVSDGGCVIGVVTSRGATGTGIGFAVPVQILRALLAAHAPSSGAGATSSAGKQPP